MRVTGPVAQAMQSVFDDMWRGADQVYCTNLNPPFGLWDRTCEQVKAVPDHVPEVKKYFLAERNADVFSLYRSKKHAESDEAIAAALASAQESIDVFQINFTMQIVCDFTVLLGDFCTYDDHALNYMRALVKAVDENGARARILIFLSRYSEDGK